jgi:hypothetical protein
VAALSILAFGATMTAATAPAIASGTSSSHYGCYTEWWNTAWAQKCPSGAQVVGNYESSVYCSAQGTRYLTKYRLAGNSTTYSGSDCAFSVSNGTLTYLGY